MIIVCRRHSRGTKRKLEYGVKDKNEEDDEIPKKFKWSRKDESKSRNEVKETTTKGKKRKEKELEVSDHSKKSNKSKESKCAQKKK